MRMSGRRGLLAVFATNLLLSQLTLCTDARGEAFRLLNQGAAATGQGGAFAAQADDPSAIYYNPAGMTQLRGVQIYTGVMLVGGTTEFTSPTGATTTGPFPAAIAFPPPAHLYLTANLPDIGVTALGDLSAGLGVVSRFGLLTSYPDDAPFATAVTSAALPLLDIKPTLAYRITDRLSIGLGADIYTFAPFLGQGHFELKFDWPGGGGIPAGTPVELSGTGTTAGFSGGLLYSMLLNGAGKPLLNLGFQYHSRANLPVDGEFLANGVKVADASTTLRLPRVLTGAVAVWPIRDAEREWKIEADLDYVFWDTLQNLNVRLSNGVVLPFPQDWKNSVVVYAGTEYKWLKMDRLPDWELALRAGYWFSETPIPDFNYNPAVPDANNHTLSFGVGVRCRDNARFLGVLRCGDLGVGRMRTKAISLDLAYQAVLYQSRTITGNRNPTVDGTYESTLHAGTISLRVEF
jgi:long-chain fatty acid transport protein